MIAQARVDGIPDKWMEAARKSPVYKMAVEWKVALPLHPEYRTLPMVWYVPPLSPISAAANAGHVGANGEIPDVNQLRIPVKYLANLLTAGDTAPVVRALERMLAMRAYQREKHVDGRINQAVLKQVGITPGRGRGHVPRDGDRQLRGPLRDPDARTANTPRTPSTCAAAAASASATAARKAPAKTSLFGSDKKRTIPIKAEV